jgi:N-acetylneuraminate synthase/sialic acid synthase
MKGTDHAFSLEPTGMEKMIRDLQLTRLALGAGQKKVYDKEKEPIRKMSKMLVYSNALQEGTELTKEHFSLKSPNDGISPQLMNQLIGKRLAIQVSEAQVVSFEDLV